MSAKESVEQKQQRGITNLVRLAFMDGYRTGLGVAQEGIKQRFEEISADKTMDTVVNNYLDYWLKNIKEDKKQ